MMTNERKQVFQVSGMTCGHCKAAVESAISSLEGVQQTQVDLNAGKATVVGSFRDESIVAVIEDAGYSATACNDN